VTLRRRLARIEATRGARPSPDADAAFAVAAAALDALGRRAALGDPEARAELDALCRMVRP
jgi:hypothetical protein